MTHMRKSPITLTMGHLLRVWVQKDFDLFLDIPPLARHHLTVFSTRVVHAISL